MSLVRLSRSPEDQQQAMVDLHARLAAGSGNIAVPSTAAAQPARGSRHAVAAADAIAVWHDSNESPCTSPQQTSKFKAGMLSDCSSSTQIARVLITSDSGANGFNKTPPAVMCSWQLPQAAVGTFSSGGSKTAQHCRQFCKWPCAARPWVQFGVSLSQLWLAQLIHVPTRLLSCHAYAPAISIHSDHQ